MNPRIYIYIYLDSNVIERGACKRHLGNVLSCPSKIRWAVLERGDSDKGSWTRSLLARSNKHPSLRLSARRASRGSDRCAAAASKVEGRRVAASLAQLEDVGSFLAPGWAISSICSKQASLGSFPKCTLSFLGGFSWGYERAENAEPVAANQGDAVGLEPRIAIAASPRRRVAAPRAESRPRGAAEALRCRAGLAQVQDFVEDLSGAGSKERLEALSSVAGRGPSPACRAARARVKTPTRSAFAVRFARIRIFGPWAPAESRASDSDASSAAGLCADG